MAQYLMKGPPQSVCCAFSMLWTCGTALQTTWWRLAPSQIPWNLFVSIKDPIVGIMDDPQLFNRLIRDYVPILKYQQNAFDEALQTYSNLTLKTSNMIELRNTDDSILAYLCANIVFRKLTWKSCWSCKFTELGSKAAMSLNMPQSLVRVGTYPQWSLEEALDNLAKMSIISEDAALTPTTSSTNKRFPKRSLIDNNL